MEGTVDRRRDAALLEDLLRQILQAFVYGDRWQQYLKGVGTTLYVTALALALGILLGVLVAIIRTAHDQQRPASTMCCWASATPCVRYTSP